MESREFVRRSPFDRFAGKETRFRVEARGSRAETVVGTPCGVETEVGAVAFVVLDGGRRLLRANAIVEARLNEDAVAELAELLGEANSPGALESGQDGVPPR